MKLYCRANHLYDEANTLWQTHSRNGKRYRQCRTCARARQRLKYRCDEVHREKEKARCLGSYYCRKALHPATAPGEA